MLHIYPITYKRTGTPDKVVKTSGGSGWKFHWRKVKKLFPGVYVSYGDSWVDHRCKFHWLGKRDPDGIRSKIIPGMRDFKKIDWSNVK